MADDDPFADLGETLDEEPAETDTDGEPDSDDSTSVDTTPDDQVQEHDPLTDSAFSYEDAKQRPFYARQQSIDDFDSWLKYELEREISEQGYQNIVVRELTDALLRTVVEEDLVQEVAQRFEQARESAPSESNE